MTLSTAAIENELMAFMSTAYFELFREYILFTVAMLISCMVIPIFTVWMFNKSDRNSTKANSPYKAYTHKETTPLGIHTVVEIMMPVLAAREMYNCLRLIERTEIYGVELIVFCSFLLLLAVLAVAGLLKFRSFGLLLAGAFVLCFAAFKQYQNLLSVAADLRDQVRYEVIGQYTLYVVHDYIVTQSMAISFVALVTLTLLAIYYYKRRFLFMPRKLSLPSCKYCGQVISKGDDFCTCCGKRLPINPIKQVITSLDRKPFCRKCGSFTNQSVCIKCSKTISDYGKRIAKEKVNEMKMSLIRGLILAATIIAIILLSANGSVNGLERGSAKVNNAFVERWIEFDHDPVLASEPEWLAGFDSAAEALYQVDARWLSVKPRSVPSNYLVYFMVYADASFLQMKALEQSVENVHRAAQGELTTDEIHTELAGLQDEFYKTIDLQASALMYYGPVYAQWDILGMLGYICFDGLRTLLPKVNILLVSIVCIVSCALILVYILNEFSGTTITKFEQQLQKAMDRADARNVKFTPTRFSTAPMSLLRRIATAGKSCCFCLIQVASGLWLLALYLVGTVGLFFSLFSPQNIGGCIHWVKAGLTDVKSVRTGPSVAYKRKQRFDSAVAAVIVVMMMGVSAFCINRLSALAGGSSDAQEYLFAAKAATCDYAVDISKLLSNICRMKTLTEEDKELFYGLIQAQIEADEVIIAYDMTGLDDYQALHAGLQSLCRDDIEALQRIKASIEDGLVPSQELQRNYACLRGENYLWVVEELLSEVTGLAVETAFDL